MSQLLKVLHRKGRTRRSHTSYLAVSNALRLITWVLGTTSGLHIPSLDRLIWDGKTILVGGKPLWISRLIYDLQLSQLWRWNDQDHPQLGHLSYQYGAYNELAGDTWKGMGRTGETVKVSVYIPAPLPRRLRSPT